MLWTHADPMSNSSTSPPQPPPLCAFFKQLDTTFSSSVLVLLLFQSPANVLHKFLSKYGMCVCVCGLYVRLDGATFECLQLSYWLWLCTHNRIQIVVSLWTYIIMCLSIISIIITFSCIYFFFLLGGRALFSDVATAYFTFYSPPHFFSSIFFLLFSIRVLAYRFTLDVAFFSRLNLIFNT